MRSRYLPQYILFTLVAVGAPACQPLHGQFQRLSETQEIELGREAAQEVLRTHPVLRNRAAQNYVNRLGQRLARNSGRNIPYHFTVLDRDEINAFALPGGHIFLNRGVLDTARSDSEVAGVLAHEISHVTLRHSVEQLQRAQRIGLGLGILDLLVGRGTGGQIANLAGQMVGGGIFFKYSRDAERAADRLGVQLMRHSGFNPMGMLTFLERLERSSQRGASGFFSSHPSLRERRRNIADLIGTRNAARGR
ncbi:MAG: M48 family metalloprotease [Acidobacteria bacterium]|nr:M48 family metalloprotease [Acidobacteriota bacterium]